MCESVLPVYDCFYVAAGSDAAAVAVVHTALVAVVTVGGRTQQGAACGLDPEAGTLEARVPRSPSHLHRQHTQTFITHTNTYTDPHIHL